MKEIWILVNTDTPALSQVTLKSAADYIEMTRVEMNLKSVV